jgi:hypothetical protein
VSNTQTIIDIAKVYAHEVAVDTAMLTGCFTHTYPEKTDIINWLDVLARAGQALREVESTPGFVWEKQYTDYESCCQELAEAVYKNPKRKHFVPVVRTILQLP